MRPKKPGSLTVTYHFEIEGLSSFSPKWVFPKRKEDQELTKIMPHSSGCFFPWYGGAGELLENHLFPESGSGSWKLK